MRALWGAAHWIADDVGRKRVILRPPATDVLLRALASLSDTLALRSHAMSPRDAITWRQGGPMTCGSVVNKAALNAAAMAVARGGMRRRPLRCASRSAGGGSRGVGT